MRNVGLRQTKTVTMTKPLTIQTLVAADSLGRVDAHWNDAVSVVAEEATRKTEAHLTGEIPRVCHLLLQLYRLTTVTNT